MYAVCVCVCVELLMSEWPRLSGQKNTSESHQYLFQNWFINVRRCGWVQSRPATTTTNSEKGSNFSRTGTQRPANFWVSRTKMDKSECHIWQPSMSIFLPLFSFSSPLSVSLYLSLPDLCNRLNGKRNHKKQTLCEAENARRSREINPIMQTYFGSHFIRWPFFFFIQQLVVHIL